ncbi:MAG: DUF58 domain-containing protein [Pseudomonadota bacterium]
MLWLAAGTLVLSVLALILGGLAREAALGLWVLLIVAGLADAAVSYARLGEVTVDFKPEVFVGENAELTFDVARWRPGMVGRVAWPEGLRGPDAFAFDAGRAEVTAQTVRRGTFTIDRLWLMWTSRFELWEFVPSAPMALELRVVPNIRVVQSGNITTQVASTLYGIKENRAIGEGSEFHQLRDFQPGMDIKSIDWKRSAKKRNLVARELRAERNHHVIIAMDNGYLMREEVAGLPKIDHAITAALATAWAAAIGGDLVGYYAYDTRPRSFVKPEPGRLAFARLRSWTAGLEYVSRETNHTLAMSELNARTPKRSLIITFTDFLDTTSAELLLENIKVLSKRHLVVFVTLRDPTLEALISSAPQSMGGVADLVAGNQKASERRLVFEKLLRMGVTVLDVRPGELTARLVSTYLDIKARELI